MAADRRSHKHTSRGSCQKKPQHNDIVIRSNTSNVSYRPHTSHRHTRHILENSFHPVIGFLHRSPDHDSSVTRRLKWLTSRMAMTANDDKKLSCRLQTARRICALGNGVAYPLKHALPHMCYHAEFGLSTSKGKHKQKKNQLLGALALRPLGWETGLTPRKTPLPDVLPFRGWSFCLKGWQHK